jgi:hypothetical protein
LIAAPHKAQAQIGIFGDVMGIPSAKLAQDFAAKEQGRTA